MMQKNSQTETGKELLAAFDLIEGTSESTRAKTSETFLELLGARVRNPNTRSAYQVAWRSFLAFCSARQLELESVKAYHVGAWLDQHPGSRSTQRQHLAAVRLLFDSLMMRGVVEYNPAARARPPRLVRESSHTPVFEEAEIVAFLDSLNLESLKDIRDKAIFSVLFYSWCRVSALINLTVAITTNAATRAGYGSKKNEGKNTKSRCIRRLKKQLICGLNALAWLQIQVLPCFLPLPRIVKRLNRDAWIVVVS